jgi:hypothetical protein
MEKKEWQSGIVLAASDIYVRFNPPKVETVQAVPQRHEDDRPPLMSELSHEQTKRNDAEEGMKIRLASFP